MAVERETGFVSVSGDIWAPDFTKSQRCFHECKEGKEVCPEEVTAFAGPGAFSFMFYVVVKCYRAADTTPRGLIM